MIFIFDLDGTLTQQETLPLIAAKFGKSGEIEALTREAVSGVAPFEQNFIRRVQQLGTCPVSEVSNLLGGVSCFENLKAFIRTYSDQCVIATGNLDVWIEQLVAGFGCPVFSSTSQKHDDGSVSVLKVLRKEDVVRRYQDQGHRVVFIGDGANDVVAMQMADVAIACGFLRPAEPCVTAVCDVTVQSEDALLRELSILVKDSFSNVI